MKKCIVLLLSIFFAVSAFAAELSPKALEGEWLFSHMFLDGSPKEMKVNTIMKFKPDGIIINNPNDPVKRSEAKYAVKDGSTIIYSDERGEQVWKVKEFTETDLRADHKGALMVFKRQ